MARRAVPVVALAQYNRRNARGVRRCCCRHEGRRASYKKRSKGEAEGEARATYEGPRCLAGSSAPSGEVAPEMIPRLASTGATRLPPLAPKAAVATAARPTRAIRLRRSASERSAAQRVASARKAATRRRTASGGASSAHSAGARLRGGGGRARWQSGGRVTEGRARAERGQSEGYP